jgi:serine/threonine protein kinase
MASVTSNSNLSVSRSELLQSSSVNVSLATVNTIRNQTSTSRPVQTADAVSLPFIVTSRFLEGDPGKKRYHHLFPGKLPEIESDLGYGASFIVQKAVLGEAAAQSPEPVAVALKRIRPSGSQTRESFHCVITDLLCLTHPLLRYHENIVDLLGLGWEDSPSESDHRLWPYLILEYSSIGSLADLQTSRGPLTYRQKEMLSQDVAYGLSVVHFSNIVHGDIKSDNVLVFPDKKRGYVAKLSDFGFATLDVDFPGSNNAKIGIDEERKTARISTGTRPWTAPEFGKMAPWQHAFKADVYSWGLLVWRVFLDGQNPFAVFKKQFESRSGVSTLQSAGGIQAWKEQNLVLPVAVSFAQTLQPSNDKGLENAFRNSLDVEAANRDLRKAFIPWRYGPR